MYRFTILTLLCASFIHAGVHAQEVNGVVSATTIGTEELITFTLEISGADPGDIRGLQPPDTEGLRLVSPNPSQQSNVSIVNGRISRSVGYAWRYQPEAEGQAKILSTSVEISGERYTTAPVTITVVPQSQRPQRQRRSIFDPFGIFEDPQPGQAPPQVGERDIFIQAVPSAREAYQNEQVTINYELYFKTGTQPRNSRLADSWDAEGFWREELEVTDRPVPRTTVLEGQRYSVIVLKRVAVFPTRSGELSVDPLRIATEVLPTGEVLFSRPFFSLGYVSVERASPAINIRSKPLPADAPGAFTGAVGRYTMQASLSRESVEVGEPLQLVVTLHGTGNIALLEKPSVTLPGIFEVYDPEVNTSMANEGSQVRGSKIFTWLLVPRSNGTFEFPPIRFAYFDPNAERYATEEVLLPAVTVTGTASSPAAVSTTALGFPVDDIAPLLRSPRWVPAAITPLHRRMWLYVLLLLPIFALGATLLARRRVTRLATDTAWARQRRAHPFARKHLKRATELCKQDSSVAFYEVLESAILGFIGNRINVAELGMTRTQLGATLIDIGISEMLQSDTLAFLEACDAARFAPQQPVTSQMEAHLAEARKLLSAIAHELEAINS